MVKHQERKMKNYRALLHYLTMFFLFFVPLLSCVSKEQTTVPQVTQSLSTDTVLEPGLPVYFRYSFYRHIDIMPTDETMMAEGTPGKPVIFLNHRFQESVFDSNAEKGVGVFLKGYLKMDAPGIYHFKAMSNDGIRVVVNGEEVVLDPTVHSDRFSDIGQVNINKTGWYPLTVKYFQRKGTARLELYWQPPGTDTFEIIPAAAYGHVK
jgi:PA14 domain